MKKAFSRGEMSDKDLAIGVDLGGTKIACGLVNSRGEIISDEYVFTDVKGGYPLVAQQIIELIRKLLAKAKAGVKGIGIGVPGQVELGTGLIRFAPNLQWHHAPLKQDLEKALGIPVKIVNDVRAITWAEWSLGAGRGCKNLICLAIGTGIGSGIVSGGILVEGASNTAGEVGHLMLDPKGPKCGCGNYGCFEALCGGLAIGELAKNAVIADPSKGKKTNRFG